MNGKRLTIRLRPFCRPFYLLSAAVLAGWLANSLEPTGTSVNAFVTVFGHIGRCNLEKFYLPSHIFGDHVTTYRTTNRVFPKNRLTDGNPLQPKLRGSSQLESDLTNWLDRGYSLV